MHSKKLSEKILGLLSTFFTPQFRPLAVYRDFRPQNDVVCHWAILGVWKYCYRTIESNFYIFEIPTRLAVPEAGNRCLISNDTEEVLFLSTSRLIHNFVTPQYGTKLRKIYFHDSYNKEILFLKNFLDSKGNTKKDEWKVWLQ